MKVEIINPEVIEKLYHNHGIFACTCYHTPEKFADKVGKMCSQSNHMSGSRCEYIKFRVTDIDRGTAEQILRHEIGTSVPYEYQDNYSFADYSELITNINPTDIVKNMASFRYIDKDGFNWAVPKVINDYPKAKKIYDALMQHINNKRNEIKAILDENGVDKHKSNEAVNFVLPRATTSEFVIGFTPEALIHFCHKRLCTRAQEFVYEMAQKMKKEVAKYSAEFAEELTSHCDHLLWCPEGDKSCGRKPTKEQLKMMVNKDGN